MSIFTYNVHFLANLRFVQISGYLLTAPSVTRVL